MAHRTNPIIVLFGYDSSTFTLKVRLALKIKQIPYTFVKVPTMMPRPLLRDNFNLTYRKIPVLAMGRELYVTPCVERLTEPTRLGFSFYTVCLKI
jgi:glutathione S-transferase